MTSPSSAMPDNDLRRRLERLLPLILMVAVLLAAILSITPWPVGAYEDDAIYTLLAKALATGEGYRMINLPGSPHATHYPPGYPFLLSLLWRVSPEFPDNVVVFKFANAVLLAVASGGMYWFARARLDLGAVGAAVVAAFGTASITMLQLAGLVLSEPLFVALLFAALIAIERCVDGGNVRLALLAGALLGAMTMVRTIGIVAIAGAVLVLLLRRRLMATIAVVAAAALFLVPWQLWIHAYGSEVPSILMGKYGSYSTWLADGYKAGGLAFGRDVVIYNLYGVANTLSYAVMPLGITWVRILSLAVLVPTVIAGLVVLARRAPVFVAFFAGYLALIIIWPFDPYRFLIAFWPVLVLVIAAAIRAAWQWRPTGRAWPVLRASALGAGVLLMAGHVGYNWRERQSWTDLQRRAGLSAKPLVEWVATNTRPGDVLSTEHDVVVYLYTGRRGVPISTFLPSQRVRPFSPSDNVRWIEAMITTFEPRFVITGWPAHMAAADVIAGGTKPALRKLGFIPNHAVYERLAP